MGIIFTITAVVLALISLCSPEVDKQTGKALLTRPLTGLVSGLIFFGLLIFSI